MAIYTYWTFIVCFVLAARSKQVQILQWRILRSKDDPLKMYRIMLFVGEIFR